MTKMPMETASFVSRVFLAVFLWVASAMVGLAATPVLSPSVAVVSAADGPPFDLVRGARLFAGTRGTHLSPGDLIKTRPGNILILEFKTGPRVTSLAAVGPSSRIYWMDQRDSVKLAVLSGWIKIDTLTPGQQAMVIAEGARLHAASDAGSYVMHVSDTADEVFQERGSMTLDLSRGGGGAHSVGGGDVSARRGGGDTSVPTRPDQLTRRTATGQIQTRLSADATFVNALPPTFLDPLPAGLGAQLYTVAQPQLVREVAYDDVADWLAAPKEWRRGFVRRFRPRLKDPAFFQALDAQMTTHPEWAPILHPPEETLKLSSVTPQH
jgi:hypothetical protein